VKEKLVDKFKKAFDYDDYNVVLKDTLTNVISN
jgi:hypothetical protein